MGGLHFDISHHLIQRAGATVDTDLNLPYGIRLLFGGELFYESLSNDVTEFDASPSPLTQLPLYCPVDPSGAPLPHCPRQFDNDASRGVGAVYLSAQWRPLQKLTFDGGVRIQKGFGPRPYDLTPLYSGAIVWNFLPDFHLKANYTTGFRPPAFQSTESSLGGLNYGGKPNLKTETSQSFQGEVNARLLRNVRKVRELELRIDYSYTFLDRLITIHQGSYGNTGKRAIHSVEGYAKLYLNGDHFLQASYTYLYGTQSDSGVQRNVPNHWFSLGASFNVIKHIGKNKRGFGDVAFDVNTNFRSTSSARTAPMTSACRPRPARRRRRGRPTSRSIGCRRWRCCSSGSGCAFCASGSPLTGSSTTCSTSTTSTRTSSTTSRRRRRCRRRRRRGSTSSRRSRTIRSVA